MPYKFAWAVKDDYTYNDYAHEEVSHRENYFSNDFAILNILQLHNVIGHFNFQDC